MQIILIMNAQISVRMVLSLLITLNNVFHYVLMIPMILFQIMLPTYAWIYVMLGSATLVLSIVWQNVGGLFLLTGLPDFVLIIVLMATLAEMKVLHVSQLASQEHMLILLHIDAYEIVLIVKIFSSLRIGLV
jgi:hypothetical protein